MPQTLDELWESQEETELEIGISGNNCERNHWWKKLKQNSSSGMGIWSGWMEQHTPKIILNEMWRKKIQMKAQNKDNSEAVE